MGFIGNSFPKLESWLRSFSIELFADVLKPAWIEKALEDQGRQSLRVRKLPSGLFVWLCIGLGLYRTLSIPNVLSRLGTILGVGSLWDRAAAPASTAITEARDLVGFGPRSERSSRSSAITFWVLIARGCSGRACRSWPWMGPLSKPLIVPRTGGALDCPGYLEEIGRAIPCCARWR